MSTATKIDTSIITGPRVPGFWVTGPIKKSTPNGYYCDSPILGGGYVWFAVGGSPVLVSEAVVEAMAADVARFNDLVESDGMRHAIAVFQGEVAWRPSVDEIKAAQAGTPVEKPEPVDIVDVLQEAEEARAEERANPKNLADALKSDYPGFEAALRDSTQGHKAVAEAFPFTSETSVRRWRKANGVEVVK